MKNFQSSKSICRHIYKSIKSRSLNLTRAKFFGLCFFHPSAVDKPLFWLYKGVDICKGKLLIRAKTLSRRWFLRYQKIKVMRLKIVKSTRKAAKRRPFRKGGLVTGPTRREGRGGQKAFTLFIRFDVLIGGSI